MFKLERNFKRPEECFIELHNYEQYQNSMLPEHYTCNFFKYFFIEHDNLFKTHMQ